MIMLNKMANRNFTYPVATAGLLIVFITSAYAQIPKLNSNAPATATVYIDLDGHTVEGTAWNWELDIIKAKPAGLTAAAIEEIFQRVAEDFTIFNINITTDAAVYSKAPATKRVRVIVTPSSAWYPEAPGVSYVNSFTWGDGTPSWVFSDRLYNDNKYIGEAISHEIGHTLGLQHQSTYDKNCNKILEYAEGKGEGETGWAPIMGVGYYKNITTWTTGTNSLDCHEIQNDIDIICNGVSKIALRGDDHGSTLGNATVLPVVNKNFSSKGLIGTASDKDVFKLVLNTTSVLKAAAVPKNVGAGNSGANIDIKISLIKSNGDTIKNYNPRNSLSASLDTNLRAGTYYLVIDGVANQNLPEQGSIGYYTLSGTVDPILPIGKLTIKGILRNNMHSIGWSIDVDEPMKGTIIESSPNGVDFISLKMVAPTITSYNYRPSGKGAIFYRIKMMAIRNDTTYYSNVISMDCPEMSDNVRLLGNMITNSAQVNINGNYAYQMMDETGRMLQNGKLVGGLNNIGVNTMKKGVLLLYIYNKKERQVFRLIKQ